MHILCPYYDGDMDEGRRNAAMARQLSGGRHTVLEVYNQLDGVVPEWDFSVRPNCGPLTCSQLICGMVHRLPPDTVFLWMEPDACFMRESAMDDLEQEFERRLKETPDLCVMGHDKRDQLDRLRHVSGVSVYRTSYVLLHAMEMISKREPHDVALSRLLLDTPAMQHTELIRCVWRFEREEYLLDLYEGDRVRVVKQHPEAAVIHGDRTHVMHDIVWGGRSELLKT